MRHTTMVLSGTSAASPPPPPPPPTGPSASITARTVSHVKNNGTTATPTYELNSNGNVYNHANTLLEAWLDSGLASQCQCRATFISGDTLTSGTLDTWQALSTTRSWSISTNSEVSSTIKIEIRNASTQAVLTSANISLYGFSDIAGGG